MSQENRQNHTTYVFTPRKTDFMKKRRYSQLRALNVFTLSILGEAQSVYLVKPCDDSPRCRRIATELHATFNQDPEGDDVIIIEDEQFSIENDDEVIFAGQLKARTITNIVRKTLGALRINPIQMGAIRPFSEIPCANPDKSVVFCRMVGEYTWLLYIKIDEYTARRVCTIHDMSDIDTKLDTAIEHTSGTQDRFHPDEFVQVYYVRRPLKKAHV